MTKKLSDCLDDAEKKEKKHLKLVKRLEKFFRPFVEKQLRSLIENEMRQPLSDEEAGMVKEILKRFPPKDLSNDVQPRSEAVFPAFTPEEIEKEVKAVVAEETKAFVLAWFQTFWLSCKLPYGGTRAIDARTIDDSMLLPLSEGIARVFEQSLAAGFLNTAQAREVLRQTRASLPAGKILPDEIVELLELNGFKVVT